MLKIVERFIHKFNKIGAWFMGGSLLIGLMIMLPHISAEVLAKGTFNMKSWFANYSYTQFINTDYLSKEEVAKKCINWIKYKCDEE